MRIYLDTSPVVYAVERVAEFAATVDLQLSVPDVICVASDLTRLECRVKPLCDRDAELLRDYDEFFDDAVAEIVGLTRAVLDLATEIRARQAFKTPDAIHLAAAVSSGCDLFLTNDQRLARFAGIVIHCVA